MSAMLETGGRLKALGNLNKTVFGALLSGILAVLFMLSVYVPVLGAVMMFFCPVPIVLMHVRFRDAKYTFLVVLVSSTLIGIFAGPLSAVAFFLGLGLQGISLGGALASGRSAGFAIVACALVILASTILSMFTIDRLMGVNLSMDKMVETFNAEVVKLKTAEIEALKKAGTPADQIAEREKYYDQIIVMIKAMPVFFPMSLFMASLISAFINYKAAAEVLRRLNFEAPALPDFATWKLSWVYLWGLIIGLFLVNTFDAKAPGLAGYLNLAGKNINLAFFFAFFINGLAVTHHFFKLYAVNTALRIFLYAMIMLHPLFNSLVLVTGVLDPWFDVRKLEREPGGDDNQLTKEV